MIETTKTREGKDLTAMAHGLQTWMNINGWANLTRDRVYRYADSMNLTDEIMDDLMMHMNTIRVIFEDDSVAGMAGCMFLLGVTHEDDDWS